MEDIQSIKAKAWFPLEEIFKVKFEHKNFANKMYKHEVQLCVPTYQIPLFLLS